MLLYFMPKGSKGRQMPGGHGKWGQFEPLAKTCCIGSWLWHTGVGWRMLHCVSPSSVLLPGECSEDGW